MSFTQGIGAYGRSRPAVLRNVPITLSLIVLSVLLLINDLTCH
jgi:hypothetical protein